MEGSYTMTLDSGFGSPYRVSAGISCAITAAHEGGKQFLKGKHDFWKVKATFEG
jgi:hypothetical protein